jgi:hypothetical protein
VSVVVRASALLLLLATGCGKANRPAEPPPMPPVETYRALWVRLAAERNAMTSEAFVARTTVTEAPEIRCDAGFGTCAFEVTYRYRVAWIELTEQDRFFVRTSASGPWLTTEQIFGDLERGASSPEHIGRMHKVDKPLAFASLDEAKAAFTARFKHAPKPEVAWRPYPLGSGTSHRADPVLEGTTHGCTTEVLQLLTGAAGDEADRYCFEDDNGAPR